MTAPQESRLQVFDDYEQLEALAWKMHDALVEICDAEKRDPNHLFDIARMQRIGRLDAARCAFREWIR